MNWQAARQADVQTECAFFFCEEGAAVFGCFKNTDGVMEIRSKLCNQCLVGRADRQTGGTFYISKTRRRREVRETSGLAISAPIQMSPASAEALLRYLDIQVCERFVDKE